MSYDNLPDWFLDAPIQLGLIQQGHIPTIEIMLAEGKTWEEIGAEINWDPGTAQHHYELYMSHKKNMI